MRVQCCIWKRKCSGEGRGLRWTPLWGVFHEPSRPSPSDGTGFNEDRMGGTVDSDDVSGVWGSPEGAIGPQVKRRRFRPEERPPFSREGESRAQQAREKEWRRVAGQCRWRRYEEFVRR